MTLPLSGPSLRRGSYAVLGLLVAVLGGMTPTAKALTTETNTNTSGGWGANNSTTNFWNGTTAFNDTNWATATTGSNYGAVFTNIGGSIAVNTNIYLNSLRLNQTNNSSGFQIGTSVGNGTLSFVGASTTLDLTGANNSINSTLSIYSSLIITNTTLNITGPGSALLNLYASNNFGGGTLTEQGGTSFGIFNVYGTNNGGTYNLAGNTSSVAGLITNATAINAANTFTILNGGAVNATNFTFTATGKTLLVNDTNQFSGSPVLVLTNFNINNTGAAGNTLQVNSSFSNITGSAINALNYTLLLGSSINLNSASTNATNNTFGSSTVTLAGGTFNYNGASSTNSLANIGSATITGGVTSFFTSGAGTTNSTLALGGLTMLSNSTLQTALTNASTPNGRVVVTNAPSLVSGILPWAVDTAQGGFLTVNATNGTNYLVGYTASTNFYVTNSINGAAATANIRFTNSGTTTLSASQTNNSLTFTPGGVENLALGANTLTVGSGGILLNASNTAATISGGTLTAGNAAGSYQLYLWNTTTAALTVASTIADSGANPVTLIKAGTGSGGVILSASNSYTGATLVQSGTLTLTNGGDLRNSAITVASTNGGSSAAFNNYGGTVSNVTVGIGPANANGQITPGFYNTNGTILGQVTIAPQTNNGATWLYAGINPAGSAKFDTGTTATNVVVGGQLIISGAGAMSVSGVSGTTNAAAVLNGANSSPNLTPFGLNGQGVITVLSGTYTNGGAGNTISLANGSNAFSAFTLQSNSFITLSQSGSSTTSFGVFGYNPQNQPTSYSFNSSVTLNGGVWNLGAIGQGNTGGFNLSTNVISGGATVNLLTNYSYFNAQWVINNGALNLTNSSGAISSGSMPSRAFEPSVTVGGSGTLNMTGGGLWTLGNNGTGSNSAPNPSQLIVNGGVANVTGGIQLSMNSASVTNEVNLITVTNGGLLNLGPTGGITMNNNVNGSTWGVSNIVTLAGGTISGGGTLGFNSGLDTLQTNGFFWQGGTLSLGTINAISNATVSWSNAPVGSSISNNTLYNTNSGTLAVGAVGAAGKTTIQGNYTQGGSGTLAFDIQGKTQGAGYSNGVGSYDALFVNTAGSGTVSLNGAAALAMNSFDEATNGSALTLITSLSNVGSFSSATLNSTSAVAGIKGSFTNGLGYTNYSFLNTNGFGAYELLTTNTTVTFTYTTNNWVGGTNWGTSAGDSNAWSAGITPNSSNAVAYFGTGSSTNVTVDSSVTVGGMIFTNASGYTIVSTGTGSLTLDGSALGGTAIIRNQAGTNTISTAVTLNTAMELTNSGLTAIIFAGGISGTGSIQLDSGATITLSNATVSSTVSNAISGAGGVTVNGSGTTVLSGNNTFTGGTTVSAGTLALSNSNALGANTGSLTLSGGTLSMGAYNATVGAVTIGNAALTFISGGGTLTATSYAATNTVALTLSNSLAGTGTLTKTGAGTLTLTGVNSYLGGTTLSGGVLSLGSASAIGSSGTLTFNGGTLQYGSSNTTDYSGRFATNASQAFNFDLNGQNVTFANGLTNNGTTTLSVTNSTAGNGTLTLSGANTYTGTTKVSGGSLTLNGSLSNSAITVTNATFTENASGLIAGTTSLTVSTGGTATLSSSNTYTGTTTVSGGNLTLATNGAIGTNALTISSGTLVNNAGVTNTLTGSTTINSVAGLTSTLTNAGGVLTLNNYSIGYGTNIGTNILAQSSGTITATIGYMGGNSSTNQYNQLLLTGGTFNSGAGYYLNMMGGSSVTNLVSASGGAILNFSAAFNLGGNSGVITAANNTVTNNGGTITAKLRVMGQNGINTVGQGSGTWTASQIDVGGIDGLDSAISSVDSLVISGGAFTNTGTTSLGKYSVSNNNSISVTGGSATFATITIGSVGGFVTNGSSTLTVSGNTNTITLGGGTLTANSISLAAGSIAAGDTNKIIWNGGVLRAGTNTGSTFFTNMANTLVTISNAGGIFDAAGFSNTIAANIGGQGTLTVTNSQSTGVTTLSGSNSNVGGINLAGGSTILSGANVVGNGGTIAFSGGTLRYTTNASTTDYSGSFSTAANQAYRFDTAGTNATLAGNLTSAGGTLALTNSTGGNGTLTLTGTNTYSGTTAISAGVLAVTGSGSLGSGAVANNGMLTLNSSANFAIGSMSGAGTFTKGGSGTVTLTGSPGSFSGSGTVTAGTLALANGAGMTGGNLAVNSGATIAGAGYLGNVTLKSGSTVAVTSGATAGTLTVSSLIVNGGTYTWNYQGSANDLITSTGSIDFTNLSGANQLKITAITNSSSAAWPSDSTNFTIMTANGGFTSFNAANIDIQSFRDLSGGVGNWSINTNGNNLVVSYQGGQLYALVASPGTTTSQSVVTNAFTGGNLSSVALSGGGEYILDLTNSYGGQTTIGAGTLTATGTNSFAQSYPIQIGTTTNGGAAATLNINTAGGVVTNSIIVSGNGINTITGTNTGGVIYSGNVSLATNVTLASVAGGDVILSGTVSGAGTATVSGAGTVTLAAGNTYSGGTVLNSGTLAVSNNAALGSGTLTVTGNSTVQALTSVTLANNATITNGVTETLDANGNNLTNSGNISGQGAILARSSTGAGTVTLSGSNNYTGASTVNSGALALGSANALPSVTTLTVAGTGSLNLNGYNASVATLSDGGVSTGVITNSAITTNTLTVSGSSASSFAGTIAGALGLTKSGTGTLTLLGTNTYAGTTAISNGASLTLGSTALLGGGNYAGAVTDNGYFALGQSGSQTFTGAITGSGSLSFNGSGTTVLNNSANPTGGVSITSGLVRVGISNALSTVTLSGGVLDLNGLPVGAGGGGVSLLDGGSTNGVLTNSSTTGATFQIGNSSSGYTSTFGGTIAGGTNATNGIALYKYQASTAVLSGTGTLTTLNINAGNLVFTNNANFISYGYTGNGTNGTIAVGGSASLTITTAGGALINGNNWLVSGGTVNLNNDNRFNLNTTGQTFTQTGGTFNVVSNTYGVRNGNYNGYAMNDQNTVSFTQNQSGGLFSVVGGSYDMGGAGTNSWLALYNLSGNGTLSISGSNLEIGAGTNGGQTIFNQSGGKLLVSGSVQGNAAKTTGAPQDFVWSGGQLSVGTFVATYLGSSSNSTNFGTLSNSAGTLAPGDLGVAGKTTITGNYWQGGSGTLAIDVLGTNIATAFTNAGAYYDTVSVSGSATVGGTVNLNAAFVPIGNSTLTILSSTSLSSTAVLGGNNVYNAKAFNTDGFTYWTLGTNATSLQALYNTNNINQWQGGTGTWDATTNSWTAGVNPNATNLTAYFGTNGAGGTVTVTGNKTNSAMILSNNATGYTLNGPGSLTLGNAGTANLTSYGSNVVNPNIALNGQLNVGGTGTLTLGGNISGNYGIVDSNSGTVTLGGFNSYVGSTLITNGGTLIASTTNAFGSAANWTNITVNGSTLALSFGNGAWNQTSLSSLLGKAFITNNSTVALDSTLGGGTLTTSLSGGYALGIQGTGTITLEGNNSGISNGITLNSGTLAMDGSSSANSLGGGSSVLTLNGTGTQKLDLGGTTQNLLNVVNANANGGALTLTNGTLAISDSSKIMYFNSLNEASNATITGAKALRLDQFNNGSAGYSTSLGVSTLAGDNSGVGIVTVNSGTLYIDNNKALGGQFWVTGNETLSSHTGYTNASASLLKLSSAGTVSVLSSLDFGSAQVQAGGVLQLASNTALTLTNGIVSGTLTEAGSGTIIVGGSSSSDGTTLIGGTLISLNDGALGSALTLSAGTLNLSGNTNTFSTVTFAGSTFRVINGSLAATSGYTASNATVSLNLSGNGATFTAGGGTVTLTGANTYTGATLVTNGTLYSTYNAGTTYTATNAGSTFIVGAAIDPTWTAAGVGSITLNTGTILAIDATGMNFALTSSLTNGVNFTLGTYGSGTVTLGDPASSYTGVSKLAISSGTLDLGGVSALSSMSLTNVTVSGGTVRNGTLSTTNLVIASNTVASINANLVGTGALGIASNQVISLGGSNNYSGATTVGTNSTLNYASSGALSSTSSITNNGGSIYFTNSGTTNTLLTNTTITLNAGSLMTISNGARLNIGSGANTYYISLNGATLNVGSGGTLDASAVVAGLTYQINAGGTLAIASGGLFIAGMYDNKIGVSGGGTNILTNAGNANIGGLSSGGGIGMGATGLNAVYNTGVMTNGTIVIGVNAAPTATNLLVNFGSGTIISTAGYTLGTANAALNAISNAGTLLITGGGAVVGNLSPGLNEILNTGIWSNASTMTIGNNNAATATNLVQNFTGGFFTNSALTTVGGATAALNAFVNNGTATLAYFNIGNNAGNASLLNVITNTGAMNVTGASAVGNGGSNNLLYNSGTFSNSSTLTLGSSVNANGLNVVSNMGTMSLAGLTLSSSTATGGTNQFVNTIGATLSNSSSMTIGYSGSQFNIVTNAGVMTAFQVLMQGAGTNEFDTKGIFTNAGGNGFRITAGVNNVNFLGGSTSTLNGFNEGGTANNGTNTITVYNGATINSTSGIIVGYTGSVTNILVVNSGGVINGTTLNVGQAGSGNMTNLVTNNGTIALSGALQFNNQSGSNDFSRLVQGAGTMSVGSVTIGGGNGGTTNSYAMLDVVGGLFTNSGALNFQGNTNANGTNLNNTDVFQVDGGTAYVGGNIVMGNSQSLGGSNIVNLNGGSLIVNGTINLGSSVQTNVINFNGGTLIAGSSSANFLTNGVATVNLLAGGGTIDSSNNAITIGASIGGVGALTKAGTGTLTLSGSNSYTGGTAINGGAISLGSVNALGNSSISLSSGGALSLKGLSSGSTFTNNISVTSGTGIVQGASGSLLNLTGNLSKNGTILELTGGQFNVSGGITGSSANSDLWLSNATVNLSGNNTYNGPTALFGGSTLNLGVNNALPTGTSLYMGKTTLLGSADTSATNTFNLNGYSQSISSLNSFTGAGNNIITNSSNTYSTLTLTGNSSFAGSINGDNLGLTISGGTANLSGTSAYHGATTVTNGGSLNLGNTAFLTQTSNVIVNGGTLLLGGTGANTNQIHADTPLSLNGTLSMGGNGTTRATAQTFKSLTLTGDSVIDFANLTGTSQLTFGSMSMGSYKLTILDWNGTTAWGTTSTTGGIGQYTRLIDSLGSGDSALNLANISFYSGNSTLSGFLGKGQFSGNQIIPVPEPGVIVAAVLLLGWMLFSNRGLLLALIARRRA